MGDPNFLLGLCSLYNRQWTHWHGFNDIQERDRITLTPGSQLPFVPRRSEDDIYCLSAPALVCGYMDGEKRLEDVLMQEIVIK